MRKHGRQTTVPKGRGKTPALVAQRRKATRRAKRDQG